MSREITNKIATLVTGSAKQTDANAAAPASSGPKTKPTTGALAALVGPASVAVALAPNVQNTPVPAGVVKTETSKGDEGKKDTMLERVKRRSGLFGRKSTDEASPPGAVETLTAALSNLTVHAHNGKANKHHQRQPSSISIECEPTEEENGDEQSTEEENDDEHSPILGGPHLIQVPGPMKGAQRNTRSQSTLHPTDEEAKNKNKKKRGNKGARIATHHPSDAPPDEDDIAMFRQRLDALLDHLQTLVLSHGGNTHRDMLQVMTRVERHLREGSPLLRIVYKTPEDYTQRRDGKPPKARQKPGIKSVFCCLCPVERNYQTIGHAAAHLTETHWELKPWRCFTCDERFPHSDTRMTEHTRLCSEAAASGWDQTLGFTNTWDTNYNGSGSGVFYGTNGVPSSQTPPESAADPNYLGHSMFAAQPPSSYQQHPYVHHTGSTFNHTPSPNHSEPSDIHRNPSSSPNVYYLPSHSPNAYIQPTSRPNTYGQPPLSLDPRYSQTDNYSQALVASPSSYGAPSPVRWSPTEPRSHQKYPSTHLPSDFPSTSRQRHAPTANTHQPATASPTHDDITYSLGSSSSTLFRTLSSTRAPVSSSNAGRYQQTAAPAFQPVQVQRMDTTRELYGNFSNVTYQQGQRPQPGYMAPRSAVHDPNYPQPNSRTQPTPSHTVAYEPLLPVVPSHFWPGEPIGQCNC